MEFTVAYRDASGKMAEKTVDVIDRNAVYAEMRRQGVVPLSVNEKGGHGKKGRKGGSSGGGGLSRTLFILLLVAGGAYAVWHYVLGEKLPDFGSLLTVRSESEARPQVHHTGKISIRTAE